MNKIYRIIWNSALNAWVAVPELTRNHTKRAPATVKTAVLATLLFATVQANATDEDEEEELESVQRSVVGSIQASMEGSGELETISLSMTNDSKEFVDPYIVVTLKAGDNLKIKQNTNENTNASSFTYSLKKDLTGLINVETEKLSFGANGKKVNIISDTKGLNFAKETAGTNGDTTVHLNGIGSTLTDMLLNTGATTNVTNDNVTDDEKKRAASVKDVLNAGWNIKGVKPGTTASDNVDFVRTYDTVEFLSADTKTTTVNVESKDNGKRTEVKIGAKTSVIKEKDGKLVTGKGKGENGSSTDEGEGLVTAKEVIDAVNKAGWRMKTTTANGQTGQADKFETVTSGTKVTFASGNGTTATVSKDDQGNITVKYDVNVGDALNVNQLQNSGWNLDSKAVAGSSGKVISGNVSPSKGKMDETVNINAGNNIEITRNGKNIDIATSMTPQFSSVSLGAGADAPTLSVDDEGALNVGSKDANKPVRITNVAPGVKEGDVTNVAQLKGVAQNLNNRIDNVDGNARAGIAQAIATAGLAQAYLPGKSMMAIGGGTYRGEAGYAIGYSSISDTGNWVIKGTASGNSRGHFGTSASVGYQW
ncbi:autotransporter adhesin NhhA [Neisseria meningitidis]|uniref:autotransporter adhesin NhhA n=1 Tax=Neisseria meningitidis TaxID=487 RepID=UPI000F791342|nr:YadA family autotransporter adhesin [Neisseria meningitidis]RQK38506.1 adhesin [Neisseria meningitidis]